MRLVRSTDTKPELLVRRITHGMGFRYRLHARDLPGVPDLVFRSKKKAIFVHGCFWHGHNCRLARTPKSHVTYWVHKIARNSERDALNQQKLSHLNWDCLVLWECELKDETALAQTIRSFLNESIAPLKEGPIGGKEQNDVRAVRNAVDKSQRKAH